MRPTALHHKNHLASPVLPGYLYPQLPAPNSFESHIQVSLHPITEFPSRIRIRPQTLTAALPPRSSDDHRIFQDRHRSGFGQCQLRLPEYAGRSRARLQVRHASVPHASAVSGQIETTLEIHWQRRRSFSNDADPATLEKTPKPPCPRQLNWTRPKTSVTWKPLPPAK